MFKFYKIKNIFFLVFLFFSDNFSMEKPISELAEMGYPERITEFYSSLTNIYKGEIKENIIESLLIKDEFYTNETNLQLYGALVFLYETKKNQGSVSNILKEIYDKKKEIGFDGSKVSNIKDKYKYEVYGVGCSSFLKTEGQNKLKIQEISNYMKTGLFGKE
jgi:hypothetical protein